MWNRSNRICVGRVLSHQIGVGHPRVHADNAQASAASFAHFFGEERSHRFLGPVVTDPQQNPPLQIVDHRQVDLPLQPPCQSLGDCSAG